MYDFLMLWLQLCEIIEIIVVDLKKKNIINFILNFQKDESWKEERSP